jgi:hypothetical protein
MHRRVPRRFLGKRNDETVVYINDYAVSLYEGESEFLEGLETYVIPLC